MISKIQIVRVAIFLIFFGAHMSILVIMKVKIQSLLKSDRMGLLNYYVDYWACRSIYFEHMSFWSLFLDPNHTPCNVGVHLRWVTELGCLPLRLGVMV